MIMSPWWKFRKYRQLYCMHLTGSSTFRLLRTKHFWSFRNTLPSTLYWVLFPIEGLRQTVETATRILTKEKWDKQLVGNRQTKDKLTSMMSKLWTRGSNHYRPLKPKINWGIRRGQGINDYYNRDRQQDRYRSSITDRFRRSYYRERPQYGQNYRERSQYVQNYTGGNFWTGIFKGAQNYNRHTSRREYRGNPRYSDLDRGRAGQGIENGKVFLKECRSRTRSRSGSRTSSNRDRIRCFKHREYDHFAKYCPNVSVTEKNQREQLQQMLDSVRKETTLKGLVGETFDRLTMAISEEMIDHLN